MRMEFSLIQNLEKKNKNKGKKAKGKNKDGSHDEN